MSSGPVPSVSVVLPTLNSERHLDACLSALMSQEYPQDRLEVLMVDAGSTDGTRELAARHGVDRVLDNPLRTGEAGKAVGIRAARGELILLLDSDNVVVGRDWLRRMVAPFADPEVMGAEVMRWDYRPEDTAVNRWHALSGVADPLTLYTGNYARESLITMRWTDKPYRAEPREGWQKIDLIPGAVPVLGANGFVIRSSAFAERPVGDYHFDLDFVHELVAAGHTTFARVDVSIGHRFCDDLRGFARKTRRRANDYFFFAAQGERTYNWGDQVGARPVMRFAISTLLVVPLLVDVARGWRRRADPAWLVHVPACWITLVVYAGAAVRGRIAPRLQDRSQWRQ